jgi:DNA polymerase-1
VQGIGEKTAQKLIAEYGSVEKIYQNIDAIEGKIKEKLVAGAEMAMVSKSLATIDCAVPIRFDLDECKRDGVDFARAQELFAELEFKSLAQRLQKLAGVLGQESRDEVGPKKPEEGKHTLAALEKFLEGQPEHVKQLDLEMVPVLARMTKYGVLVDRRVLDDLRIRFQKKIEELTKDIYDTVGHEFNLNSPKQLAVVLFDELALPVIRKTKTGRSTNEEVLQELIAAHPVIEKILQYREMFKLQSTYIEGLPKYIAEDGRIHSQFNLDVAATGRLSSTDPNLQNIPTKGQWGNEIRKAFVAPVGCTLVAMDYSQIELRILAHLSGDPGLRRIFQAGEDVHRSTAAKIFNVKPEEVTKDQRRSAKTINFGLMYGMGPRALAQDLQITFSQAELFIKAYFAAFPKVKAYMDEVVSFGTKHGYVQTILGRRRFLPELKSSDMRVRSMGVRMAINMPCQGTQAEMIKKAMVEIDKELEMTEARMILQIHDELLFEMSEECVERWIPIIRKKMIDALPLSVPIEVGVKVGKSWGEMVERD